VDRIQKLEAAVKAAMRLRKHIEPPGDVPVKNLFVSIEAVQQFDKSIQEIKDDKIGSD
jgi:hypothetical protein